MATKTEQEVVVSGRIVRAFQVSDILPDAESAPWSPSVLTSRQLPQPLEMRLTPGKEKKLEPAPVRGEPTVVAEPVSREPISSDESLEQIAARRSEDVARAVQTLLMQSEDENVDLPAHRKIAILMVGLGPDLSATVMKHCSESEIEKITRAISELERVTARQKDEIFEEIKELLLSGAYLLQGGVEFARQTLQKASGAGKAREVLGRVTGESVGGFDLLRNIDPPHLAPFLENEHPQTIALILSQLEPDQAAGILSLFPEKIQADVACRMATMENISSAVVKRIGESLEGQLREILGGTQEVGGVRAVADILNRTSPSTEKAVLEEMDAQDPELAEKIRNLMFTFDDMAKLTDREIQVVLREVDAKDLAIALKGATEETKERIFSNISEEGGKPIKEEMEFSGPMRASDVEEVQLRIVCIVRKQEKAGEITIARGGSKDIFL